MVSSVRDPVSGCHAGCLRTKLKLGASPQVSGAVAHVLGSQDVTLIVIAAVVLLTAVVLTAIWADENRRKAAFKVLDRVLPWRG